MGSPKGKEKADAESEERDANDRMNRATMTNVAGLQAAIDTEVARLPAAIADARNSWAERGGDWATEAVEPLPLTEHTAWALTTGGDWTREEKAKLSAAKQKMVTSTVGLLVSGTGWFMLTTNAVAADSAHARIDAHTEATTEVDLHLDDNAVVQASVGMAQSAYVAIGAGIAALTALGIGIREYYQVCQQHLETMGDPYDAVMAEVNTINARIRTLEAQLELECAKLAADATRGEGESSGE